MKSKYSNNKTQKNRLPGTSQVLHFPMVFFILESSILFHYFAESFRSLLLFLLSFWIFSTIISRWFLIGVWVTASPSIIWFSFTFSFFLQSCTDSLTKTFHEGRQWLYIFYGFMFFSVSFVWYFPITLIVLIYGNKQFHKVQFIVFLMGWN